jgi:hypothetical protein
MNHLRVVLALGCSFAGSFAGFDGGFSFISSLGL